jgi:hypothetical protein
MKGTDVNSQDKYGYSPLLYATSYGYTEIAKILINNNADVNISSADHSTPLLFAAQTNNFEISKLLIEKGADVFATDSSGYRALDHARFARKPIKQAIKSAEYEQNKLLIELLKETEEAKLKNGSAVFKNQSLGKIIPIIRKVSKCMTPDVDYAVYLNQDKNSNAFVNVSGNIVFTNGAIENWDDDILTFVAAHEIAHDKLGHVAKKMTVSYTTTGVMLVANALVPGLGLLNHIINPAVTNNFSKTQEYDADKLASEYCLKCFGMTIEKQSDIMNRMKDTSKGDGGGFWATHPAWGDRIKNIEK